MKSRLYLILIVLIFLLIPNIVLAQSDIKPIQISLWHPVQLYDSTTTIHGLRINLFYGINKDVHGVDAGLIVQKLTGNMKGWQPGFINLVEGNVEGLQEGLVNHVKGNFTGWQSGGININKKETHGLMTGIFNSTNHMRGVQLGFVNYAETLYGLQIGIANINNSGDPFKFLPIINFSFNK